MLTSEILTVQLVVHSDRGSHASCQALGLHQAECHGNKGSVALVALCGHFPLRSQDFPNVPLLPGLELSLLALQAPIWSLIFAGARQEYNADLGQQTIKWVLLFYANTYIFIIS